MVRWRSAVDYGREIRQAYGFAQVIVMGRDLWHNRGALARIRSGLARGWLSFGADGLARGWLSLGSMVWFSGRLGPMVEFQVKIFGKPTA